MLSLKGLRTKEEGGDKIFFFLLNSLKKYLFIYLFISYCVNVHNVLMSLVAITQYFFIPVVVSIYQSQALLEIEGKKKVNKYPAILM